MEGGEGGELGGGLRMEIGVNGQTDLRIELHVPVILINIFLLLTSRDENLLHLSILELNSFLLS